MLPLVLLAPLRNTTSKFGFLLQTPSLNSPSKFEPFISITVDTTQRAPLSSQSIADMLRVSEGWDNSEEFLKSYICDGTLFGHQGCSWYLLFIEL